MRTFGTPTLRRARHLGAGIAAGALLLSGLAGTASASSTKKSPKKMQIAYFTDSLSNVYLTTATTAAQKMANAEGAEMTVFNGNWSSATQLTQIQDAIASHKYDALVVESVDGSAVCKPLLAAAKTGTIVSIYNTPICGDSRSLYTKGTIGFFGGDDFEYGKLLAKEMVLALHGKGSVAYVSGPVDDSIVQATTAGLVAQLKKSPGIKLVSQLNGEWDAATGLTVTQDLLQSTPNIKGIIYGVDQMAIPSISWLKKTGKIGRIKIVSLGASTNAKAAIKAGTMYAGVVQLPAQEAAYAVEAAIQTFHKKPIAVPGWNAKRKVYNLLIDPSLKGVPVIDKANLKSFKAEWSV